MTRVTTRALTLTTTALLALNGAAACGTGSDGPKSDRVPVVAAFYPLRYVAERVGGDAVQVTNLAKPGAEPHDLELNPRQVGQISDARLIVYLAGFQPNVDEAITQNGGDRTFDVAQVRPLLPASTGGHDHEHDDGSGPPAGEKESADPKPASGDPHVWLDPTRLATIGDKLAERLGRTDPDRAAQYTQRAGALRAELTGLDAEYAKGLATCQRRELVTSHTAFGYLADRYQLEQIGITGLTPEADPPAQRLAEVAAEARAHGATTIFFETLVSPKVAETIAREVGARTAVLDPIEGLSAEGNGDYLSLMRANLAALRTALACS